MSACLAAILITGAAQFAPSRQELLPASPATDETATVEPAPAVTGQAIFGDFDGDADVDRHDYFACQICLSFSGPQLPIPPACQVFDSDFDGDVDMDDLAAFWLVFTGSTSRLLVEAGSLVPIMPSTHTYYSGEPDASGNNALHGFARQAGFTQDDLWYQWKLVDQPGGSGPVIIANSAQPATAFRLQPNVLQGDYIVRLTVTNLFTFEEGSDEVVLSVVSCQSDLDCDDGLFCTAYDACDPQSESAGIDGCIHYGSPCRCTVTGTPCNSALGDRMVCDETGASCDTCVLDVECDDGVDCTNDTCLGGLCIAAPIHARCPQGQFCDKLLGCVSP